MCVFQFNLKAKRASENLLYALSGFAWPLGVKMGHSFNLSINCLNISLYSYIHPSVHAGPG